MSTRNTSPDMMIRAKKLRQNMTEAENRLWSRLRAHQLENFHFRRQHAIGMYVVDFCAPQQKLIIEVDGSQHQTQEYYDRERTLFLESLGYRVIRYWNHEVLEDTDAVILAILYALEEK